MENPKCHYLVHVSIGMNTIKMLDDLKKTIQNERRWYLKCLAILTYHTFQQTQRLDKRNHKWRVSDTARELDMSIGAVSEALKLAKAIGKDTTMRLLTREEALNKLRELKDL